MEGDTERNDKRASFKEVTNRPWAVNASFLASVQESMRNVRPGDTVQLCVAIFIEGEGEGESGWRLV